MQERIFMCMFHISFHFQGPESFFEASYEERPDKKAVSAFFIWYNCFHDYEYSLYKLLKMPAFLWVSNLVCYGEIIFYENQCRFV